MIQKFDYPEWNEYIILFEIYLGYIKTPYNLCGQIILEKVPLENYSGW